MHIIFMRFFLNVVEDSDDEKNNMFQIGDAANAIEVDRDTTQKLQVPSEQTNR